MILKANGPKLGRQAAIRAGAGCCDRLLLGHKSVVIVVSGRRHGNAESHSEYANHCALWKRRGNGILGAATRSPKFNRVTGLPFRQVHLLLQYLSEVRREQRSWLVLPACA